jgi:hypothetical protein
MQKLRKLNCTVYALIGVMALIGTWGNNVKYLGLGFFGANARFWADTLVNPASRSITVDILFLMYAAVFWMLLEARRLSMKGVWLYVLFGVLVAISVAFPAFMIHRERALAAHDSDSELRGLAVTDVIGLVVLGLPMLAYAVITLGR